MITTPRGIAIPLPLDQSFCMMSRLYPKVKPYAVLQATQGFYKMHGTVACLTGILCFVLRLPDWQIGSVTFITTLTGYVMSLLAIYPPGLLRLAQFYSMLTGRFVVLIGLTILGLLTVGVIGTGLFWLSRLLAELVTVAHAKRLGQVFLGETDPEKFAAANKVGIASADGFAVRCFGNAYATFANKYGAPIVVHVTEDERASRKWRDVLKEFTQEWPEVTQRFQVAAEEWKKLLEPEDAEGELEPADDLASRLHADTEAYIAELQDQVRRKEIELEMIELQDKLGLKNEFEKAKAEGRADADEIIESIKRDFPESK